ncbi:MAG TPA: 16S rRNA (adenine(1518)-N(6)/adenine(1519)-N(6))-dimethyltransferase RsmA [Gammaproteobacteria bacterium]|nr:16S rRNA (adenine(1518)-N(6)/adenine(1519)-N(6))-dimethyltransferase RsmA [Gammaproteobacteria bacterium]
MPEPHRPRKRFGQHFLHDGSVITRIIAAIAPQPGDRLVEIGPGLGALTRPLLEAHGRLDTIELDRDVIPLLQEHCAGAGELHVHQQDALQTDFRRFADGERLRVVGNLPYNISTPLLFHLLAQADVIHDMHFMLQREVVDRICAAPNTRAYGRLTVMIAAAAQAERLLTVKPGAFRPPPAVDSAVVRLVPWREPPFPLGDPQRFAEIVAQAFNQRRKTLRNALKNAVAVDTMAAAGVDPGARAETLAPADFGRLSELSDGI